MATKPVFFPTPAAWRAWLEKNHASAREISVGFWKRDTGKPSLTWPQSVDEALAFGWIDGVRHRIDDESYRIRFTPRRPGNVWSKVNLQRFAELAAEGRIAPAGQAAFEVGKRSAYSYEKPASELTPEETKVFQANTPAWTYWDACPPGYRKQMVHRITDAKRAETRAKRLAGLIDACARGVRIDAMKPVGSQ
jgi:uncharacterized protein YdeI (YjbR/CyaY-like superfamily)